MQYINKKQKNILLILSVLIIFIILFIFIRATSSAKLVSANDIEKIINNKKVEKVYLQDKYLYVVTDKEKYRSYASGINLKKYYNDYPIEVYTKSSNYLMYIALFLLLSILVAIIAILKRNNNLTLPQQLQLSNNDTISQEEIKPTISSDIDFNSIAGISDIKEDLEEIVEFLKNPAKFKMLDIKMPKGVLLVGPPGVGKTMLAKAISSEAGVPFFYHSGANFVQIYAGMGAKRVKELFNKAKELAPSIIFIDEIDAVGKSRDKLNSDERESTLNQLLVEMDGFEENLGVVVIGATNRIDVLDSALLRAGRFDRRLFIDLPNIKEREQIIKHYLKHKNYIFDTKELAEITSGFSPASLEVLINEAWLYAYKHKKETISIEDIYAVKSRVVYGKRRVLSLNKQEKLIQAKYQSAKAIVAIWFDFKFDKLSLLNNLNINENLSIVSKEYLINKIKVLLAGNLYLKIKTGNSYSIYKDDNKMIKKILEEILENYTVVPSNNTINIQEIEKETENLLNRFDALIEKISKNLVETENLDFKKIKEELNDIF